MCRDRLSPVRRCGLSADLRDSSMPSATSASDAAASPFPEPVSPAADVHRARQVRLRELQTVAWEGIGLRIAVIVAELAAWWWWGYAALLVDMTASAFDVLSSLAIVIAIRAAARPPDDEHPFGHGRYEPLAGMQLGVVITLAGGWLAFRQVWGLATTDAAGFVSPWACLIPLAAAVVMELVSRRVAYIGRREDSTVLVAEGQHYRVDALTSLVAAVGLGAASLSPRFGHLVDLASATVLSGMMMWLGVHAALENLHQILDRVPQEAEFARVRGAALEVPGVLGVEKVRIQQAGPDAHVDIDIEVDPDLSVAEAHVITQHVRAQIQSDWPFVRDVVVHVEPYYPGDH